MLQIAFIVLLTTVIIAAVVSFCVMGIMQYRRARSLSRRAHEKSMLFAPDDPFDIACRYADFALVDCGHSPRANNVTYGRYQGWAIREFDFRYEVGHGTQRAARNYHVIIAETEKELPSALMWNEASGETVPLAAMWSGSRKGCWVCTGDDAMTDALAEICGSFADRGLSIQILRQAVMLHVPARRYGRAYSLDIEEVSPLLDRIRDLSFTAAGK